MLWAVCHSSSCSSALPPCPTDLLLCVLCCSHAFTLVRASTDVFSFVLCCCPLIQCYVTVMIFVVDVTRFCFGRALKYFHAFAAIALLHRLVRLRKCREVSRPTPACTRRERVTRLAASSYSYNYQVDACGRPPVPVICFGFLLVPSVSFHESGRPRRQYQAPQGVDKHSAMQLDGVGKSRGAGAHDLGGACPLFATVCPLFWGQNLA